jgi:Ni/Fe-hydrogenase subunit HybB-like protein
MSSLNYQDVNKQVLGALKTPGLLYWAVLGLLALGAGWGLVMWVYQVRTGMGVAGISFPVCWGVYIGNYVFWIGIAMSGTMISGMLYLVRSKFRNAVSRGAEAMTVFAVIVCGLFPLIHLGRFWVFYYILPYPSQRQIWPNFMSPLVWDVWAIGTYLIVSVIFFFVGLLPDVAAARDWAQDVAHVSPLRARLYRLLAGGWANSSSQWHHYGRGYLYFAALATPLAISVHSVTSWDFGMALLPGWHTTIYAPYFVAGAVFSGMAMALTLMIPMRFLLRLENIITVDRLEPLAKIILFTSLLVAYSYIVEPFADWYSGDIYHRQFVVWQATGWIAVEFWLLVVFNVLIPLLLLSRRIRRNLVMLFLISLCVNVGMWLERMVLTTASTAHDFLPHNWGWYAPNFVSISITAASFLLFFFGVLVFTKVFPAVAVADVKEGIAGPPPASLASPFHALSRVSRDARGVLAVFASPRAVANAVERVRATSFSRIEVFSPFRLTSVERLLYGRASPVRLWTLTGALLGLASGFALAILAALVNDLIVGGKPPVSIVPYCVLGFECTILGGTLFNLAGVTWHARLYRLAPPHAYDRRFSRDKFGLFIACEPGLRDEVIALLQGTDPEETRVIE